MEKKDFDAFFQSKEGKTIDEILGVDKMLPTFDDKLYKDMLKFPGELIRNEETDELMYKIKDDEFVVIPDVDIFGITKGANLIFEALPEPSYSLVDPRGGKYTSEPRNAYKVAVLVKYLGDGVFRNAFDSLLETYDFINYVNSNVKSQFNDFESLLNEIIRQDTFAIRLLLSACNLKISEVTKKNDQGFSSLLSLEEISALLSLKLKRKHQLILHNDSIASMEVKWEKSKEVNEFEARIEVLINDAGIYGKIYKIDSLSSRALKDDVKQKARQYAIETAHEHMGVEMFEKAEDEKNFKNYADWIYKKKISAEVRFLKGELYEKIHKPGGENLIIRRFS